MLWCIILFVAHSSCGLVNISGEEVEESKFDITMQLYAKKLDKKDFFGKVGKIVFFPSSD